MRLLRGIVQQLACLWRWVTRQSSETAFIDSNRSCRCRKAAQQAGRKPEAAIDNIKSLSTIIIMTVHVPVELSNMSGVCWLAEEGGLPNHGVICAFSYPYAQA